MRFDRFRFHRPEARTVAAPAWTVTYADFVTVLLCLFVAMLSMSTIRQDRFQTALGSLQQTFGAPASLDGSGMPDGTLYGRIRPILESQAQTKATMETSWASIARIPGGAKLILSGPLVFERGQGDIAQYAKDVLIQLADNTKDSDCTIVIRGHAAGETPAGEQSVRDLSYQRARNAARILEQTGLAPKKISVVAMGDGQPRFEHAYTEKRRAMNRRVEIEIVEGSAPVEAAQPATVEKG